MINVSKIGLKTIVKWMLVMIMMLSIIVFVRQTDFDEVFNSLNRIGWRFLAIIGVTFVAFIMGTLSWIYTLPKSAKHIPFSKLLLIRLTGESIGLINPANVLGGDSFKAYLLKKEGVIYEESISSLVVSRLIMIFSQIAMFVVVAIVFLVVVDTNVALLKILGWTLACLGTLTIMVLIILPYIKDKRLLESIPPWIHSKLSLKRLEDICNEVSQFYSKDKRRFYIAVFWSLSNWMIGSLEILLIFYFMGISISWLDALLVDQGILVLKSLGAFIPGQIGVEEYANKVMLAFIGLSSMSIWFTVSILRRSRQIFWIIMSLVLYVLHKYLSNRKETQRLATGSTSPNFKMINS